MIINIEMMMFILFVLSCIVSGAVFELIFFTTYGILLLKNRKHIVENSKFYRGFVFNIVCYVILLLIQTWYSYPDISWRPVGITKCLCGISMCMLISNKLNKYKVYVTLLRFLILFNIVAVISKVFEITELGLFEFPGQNSCICLNLIMLPHLFWVHKYENKPDRVLYTISLILMFILFCDEGAFVVGIILFALFSLIHIMHYKTIKFSDSMRKFLFVLTTTIVAILVFMFLTNEKVREFCFSALGKLDISRVQILTYGISRRAELNVFEQLFGSGEVLYPVAYGRMIQAHNMVIEMLTMYGIIGVVILSIETITFLKYIYGLKNKTKHYSAIIISLMFGYMEFMVHPFYTTSFIIKIYLVILNMNTSNYGVTESKYYEIIQ